MESFDTLDLQWWLDPTTGQLEMSGDAVDGALSAEQLEERGSIPVEPADSHRGYRDMEDFIATVQDERARAALLRAIERNRPFRRFKDTLYNYPDVGKDWYAFHDQSMIRHAITWLIAESVIDEHEARHALEEGQG